MSSSTIRSDSEEQKIFKCHSKAATKQPFSLLIIGNTNWSSKLEYAMVDYHENNHSHKIQVMKANSIKSILSTSPNIYTDLVIILLDVRKNDCLVELELNLLSLEPALLCGRTILVNPRCDINHKDMGITYENIDVLKRKYDLIIIHGNVDDYLSRMFLARRIMVFAYKVNYNGIPNVLELPVLKK
ncbi:uncharacterized protein LOC126897205 [Daktulosphaira vitifoliae]|uniref:uncharacterized protein LOC126897205 n=1 Tax=Daktulosphaira vitifoliae TaxID=58002 RepID=UPI0021A9B39B|nr:uncharacterized protein LOC126897205 [Daktulosphaira vitifoliae]